ncbi:MAG: DUF4157 domain-containing protein [Nitrosomonas sp.]|nr:DUF4157 domain-containing protein [Nitrosomonas sp.]
MKRSLSLESESQQTRHSAVLADSVYGIQAFADNRKSATAQRQLMIAMTSSPQAIAQRKVSQLMNNSPRLLAQRKLLFGESVQRIEEDESLQKKSEPIQRIEEEELQKKAATDAPAQLKEQSSAKPNDTGLPDNLKSGIESLSGLSMDSVRVHYNSSQPAQLNALAYAQGTDIHVAPGQEQHLPHEAWHVVQQAQGRVKPTVQMAGQQVNDDRGLETEADLMGERAVFAGVVQANWEAGNFIESEHGFDSISLYRPREHINSEKYGREQANQPVVQRFFTGNVIAGYNDAVTHWTQARNAVTAFDVALNMGGYNHTDNVKTGLLNTNAGLKSNKAKGTLAGESFETLQWDAATAPAVKGPGGANGIDIINYDLTGFAGETDETEVKSALDVNSANSVIAKAWSALNTDRIELYYQGPLADFSLVNYPINPGVARFNRAGDDFYRVVGPGCDFTVNIRNPAGGAIAHTLLFDVF